MPNICFYYAKAKNNLLDFLFDEIPEMARLFLLSLPNDGSLSACGYFICCAETRHPRQWKLFLAGRMTNSMEFSKMKLKYLSDVIFRILIKITMEVSRMRNVVAEVKIWFYSLCDEIYSILILQLCSHHRALLLSNCFQNEIFHFELQSFWSAQHC